MMATQPTQGYWDCSCELYRAKCYGDTPLCDNHPDNSPFEDDELPDDDPWYEPPLEPMRCDGPLKWRCFDSFCREVGCVEAPKIRGKQ
jgi:hypothetical protein